MDTVKWTYNYYINTLDTTDCTLHHFSFTFILTTHFQYFHLPDNWAVKLNNIFYLS